MRMMAKEPWTPGPWAIEESRGDYLVTANNGDIVLAKTYEERSRDEERANARLMAAAPNLYALLSHVSDVLCAVAGETEDERLLALNDAVVAGLMAAGAGDEEGERADSE